MIKVILFAGVALLYMVVRVRMIRTYKRQAVNAVRYGILREFNDFNGELSTELSDADHTDQLSKKQNELQVLFKQALAEIDPGRVPMSKVLSLAPVSEGLMLQSANVRGFIKRWFGKTQRDTDELMQQARAKLSTKTEN